MKRLFLILFACMSTLLSYSQDEERLKQELMDAFSYVDDSLRQYLFIIDDYISTNFLEGNYEAVLEAAPYHLYGRMLLVSQINYSLSEQERAIMSFLIEGNLNFHYIMSAAVYAQNADIIGFVYDYWLFVKQLQLRTEMKVSNAVMQKGDRHLLAVLDEYRNIKKQLAESNPPHLLNRDSLQQHSFPTRRSSDLDIDSVLVKGEAAVEFIKFNLYKGKTLVNANHYAALIVTKNCARPVYMPLTTEENLTYWRTDNPGDLYAVDKYGVPLSQYVWLKVLFYLHDFGVKTIYFSPVGILNNMAIESFPYDKETLMSDHFNLIRLTSTRRLLHKHNQSPKSTARLYGNLSYRMSKEQMQNSSATRGAVSPLPWTKNEVDSIQSLLNNNGYDIALNTQTDRKSVV
mgnify:CR=1 FL=1